MQLLFVVSLVVQLALAAHAYQNGRVSPWVWIILFFPLAGSLLYAYLFILPEWRRSSRRAARPYRAEPKLRRVPRGPFANAGDRPDNAIVVGSSSEIELHASREDCPECGHALVVDDHRADTIGGRDLRVVLTRCNACGATPVRYFQILKRAVAH